MRTGAGTARLGLSSTATLPTRPSSTSTCRATVDKYIHFVLDESLTDTISFGYIRCWGRRVLPTTTCCTMRMSSLPMRCRRCRSLCATSMPVLPARSQFPPLSTVSAAVLERVWLRTAGADDCSSPSSSPPDADIVCARAKNHYDPEGNFDLTESGTQLESSDANRQLEAFRANFKPLNDKTKRVMYFS